MLFKNTSPKVHLCEQHALYLLTHSSGLVDFSEQFVEWRHQIGVQDNRRSKNIKNKACKFHASCVREEQRNNPTVREIKNILKNTSKRKFWLAATNEKKEKLNKKIENKGRKEK